MTAEAWAAWVQAVGSILAIGAGFLTMYLQNRHADRVQKAERSRQAEVVAYRLSGWLSEAGVRISRAFGACQAAQAKAASGPPRNIADLIPELRLNMVTNIEAVLPDLHHLESCSGDVAQLNHFMHTYEAWLSRLFAEATRPGEEPHMVAGPGRREFYSRAEVQLNAMSTLHANAERHLSAVVKVAIR